MRQTRQYFLTKKQIEAHPRLERAQFLQSESFDLSSSRTRPRDEQNSAAVAGAMRLLKTKIVMLEEEVAVLRGRLQEEERANADLRSLNDKLAQAADQPRAEQLREELEEQGRRMAQDQEKYTNNMLDYIREINLLKDRIEELATPETIERMNRCSIAVLEEKVVSLERALEARNQTVRELQARLEEGPAETMAPRYNYNGPEEAKVSASYKAMLEEVVQKSLRLAVGQTDLQDYLKGVFSRMMKIDNTSTFRERSPVRRVEKSPS